MCGGGGKGDSLQFISIAVLQTDTSPLVHFDLISVWMSKNQYLLAQILTSHLDLARHMHFCGQPNFSLGNKS